MDINPILKENGLELVEAEFFRGKKTIFKVSNSSGENLILKTGRIEPFQGRLMKIAEEMEADLCFKVPAIAKQGAGWILMEEIKGKFLNDFYVENPDWYSEVSKKVSDDYQKVVAKFLEKETPGNLLEDGKKWLFSMLCSWGGPIIEEGLMDFQTIKNLGEKFEAVVSDKGEDFFGWFHGNIIGDHLIIKNEDVYLLDLHIASRPGKGYYDFLRALDWILLKTDNAETDLNRIVGWMKQYLEQYDREEVKLVIALRCIGILGWDMLHQGDLGKGDAEIKKKLLMKFIGREF